MTMQTQTKMFDTHAQAAAAVRDLEAGGFSDDEISIVANGSPAASTSHAASTSDIEADEEETSGTGVGASVGTIVGGSVGLLAGLGALAIPGVGPIVAAGWIVALVTGAGAGAAAGGLMGSLTGSGIDEKSAHVYAEGVRRGGTLVTVRTTDSHAGQVASILARHDSVDISAREAEYRASGWNGYRESDHAVLTAGHSTNPPGTMASRGVDDVAGTNISGARPENTARRA